MRLSGKVAIVTGSARGIGQQLITRLAREGAKVVAADVLDCGETAARVKAVGGQITTICTDVSKSDSVRNMAEKAMDAYGRIDILVNNAALLVKMKPFDQIPEEEWDRLFSINMKGVWLCSKAVYPYMKKQGQGSIINISSGTILEGVPGIAHYISAKAGVWAFTRSLAREVGPSGIRANSITVGFTPTESCKATFTDPAMLEMALKHNIESRIIQRDMSPQDLEGVITFLASEDSAFISGQNINVDGGRVHY
jgi:NAD(P)-dependent dehydrogenase (short-subunit alcohol dehydrogenase family)